MVTAFLANDFTSTYFFFYIVDLYLQEMENDLVKKFEINVNVYIEQKKNDLVISCDAV